MRQRRLAARVSPSQRSLTRTWAAPPAVRELLAEARDRYGMAAVRIYLPILIERDIRRRLQNRPSEQVNGR